LCILAEEFYKKNEVLFVITNIKLHVMKIVIILFLFLFFFNSTTMAQTISKMPDSVRKKIDQYNGVSKPMQTFSQKIILSEDDFIKEKLIALALNNPQLKAVEANIIIAETARNKANSSLLSSISIGSNLNEFALTNSAAATLFPKYNLGVSIPLDIFAKSKAEKKTADQNIIINKNQKQQVETFLKAKVLVQYEVYKEKKELLQFQKRSMEDDIAAYEKAQKDFKDEVITLEELNKIYKVSISERGLLVSKEKDLNIAIIQLEEIIGVPLKTVFEK
jgi:outer membrane protein TolC